MPSTTSTVRSKCSRRARRDARPQGSRGPTEVTEGEHEPENPWRADHDARHGLARRAVPLGHPDDREGPRQVNSSRGPSRTWRCSSRRSRAASPRRGSVVEVITFQDVNDPDFYGFNFVIRDRIVPEPEFDHEKMAHEVQHDILGLSQPGAVHQGRGVDRALDLDLDPGEARVTCLRTSSTPSSKDAHR